jgi:hypothetical protein
VQRRQHTSGGGDREAVWTAAAAAAVVVTTAATAAAAVTAVVTTAAAASKVFHSLRKTDCNDFLPFLITITAHALLPLFHYSFSSSVSTVSFMCCQ